MNRQVAFSRQNFWHESAYWLCQFVGWAFFMSVPVVSLINDWNSPARRYGWVGILLAYIFGISLTHFIHIAVQGLGWKFLPARKLIPRLFLTTVGISFIWCLLYAQVTHPIVVPATASILFGHWCIIILTFRQEATWAFFSFHLMFMEFILGTWVLFYFVAVNWKEKQSAEAEAWRLKAALATAELGALHAQMNPHFLFNSLNTLRGLISENPDRAQDAVTCLAKILRYTLQLNKIALVPLEQEMQTVDDYLSLEGLRYEDRLRVSRDIDPATLRLLIPPMTVQTLVENAIKYGVSRYPGPNHIDISTRQKNDLLEIEITNDGQLETNSESTAIGLKNTAQRLGHLLGEPSNISLTISSPGRVSAKIITPGRLTPPKS